jgi:hypothetical protein
MSPFQSQNEPEVSAASLCWVTLMTPEALSSTSICPCSRFMSVLTAPDKQDGSSAISQGKRRATLRETADGEPHLGGSEEEEEEEKEEEKEEEEAVMIVSCRSSGMLGRWALTSPTAQPPSRGTLAESSAASSAATFRANMFRAALEAE